jgi:mono/diheme cytochrome c family protein
MTLPKYLSALLIPAALGACATLMPAPSESVTRGATIYAAECAACHGAAGDGAGAASLGLGMAPPDLTGLTARNDGVFPRAFVQRFVLGQVEKEDPDAAMPTFGTVGLEHAKSAGEVTASDMMALLDYLETLQK